MRNKRWVEIQPDYSKVRGTLLLEQHRCMLIQDDVERAAKVQEIDDALEALDRLRDAVLQTKESVRSG